jgi:uncharacterized protein
VSDHDTVRARTEDWLRRAVIGLGLCPFAAPVHAGGRLRIDVCDADTPQALADTLGAALRELADADPATLETVLIVHPQVLHDFLDFNDFLGAADALLQAMDLEGTLQVAAFHPQWRFAGVRADDVAHCTNRAPYPTLHLLREDSISAALDRWPGDPDAIYERNIRTLHDLGADGWRAMFPDGPDPGAPPRAPRQRKRER